MYSISFRSDEELREHMMKFHAQAARGDYNMGEMQTTQKSKAFYRGRQMAHENMVTF